MKKIFTLISIICICISFVGCANNGSAQDDTNHNTFNQGKAISMIIKNHPDFPSNPSVTKTKKLSTGGKQSTTSNVKFSTKIVKVGTATYVVTLTKDWGKSVNGKYVKSYWKYNVTPNKVALVDSINNDYLTDIMK